MSQLFEPFQIGPMTLPNRFIRSATTSYWSDDRGILRPPIIELYRGLANGGVGLIIKGHLYVHDAGKAHRGMAGISNDDHLAGLRDLTHAVHDAKGTILAQLNHAGINSIIDKAGPSEYIGDEWVARALSNSEIDAIIQAFGDAAERAIRAGFNGVQIHGAHGYLVSQFLSRLTNRRTDNWGGTLEKRMRFLFAVYDELRTRLGSRIPILLKLPKRFAAGDWTRLKSVEVVSGGVVIYGHALVPMMLSWPRRPLPVTPRGSGNACNQPPSLS
jgi:2,4-dienoyl-CoA reductase-like NADH-dependent reductase (Old Yellow Enzyme family)